MHNDIDRDLYEILGVGRDASDSEIKTAYRNKARECHPDVAHDDPDGETKFKELTFAYEILSDDAKRSDYDMYGLEGLKRGAGIDFSGFTSFSDLIDMFFGDQFGDPFGRRRGRSARTRGRDLQTSVSITLAQVLEGVDKEIEVRRPAACSECGGTGLMPGTHLSDCERCGGSGQIRQTQKSFLGTFVRASTCAACGGRGKIITTPCGDCEGQGRRWVTETLKLKIPPGVESGDHMLVGRKGEAGLNGGPPGDLYVSVKVDRDRRFEREGKNLHSRVTVDMVEAALGTSLTIPSLEGDLDLKIDPGTQPGRTIRLKGKGLPPRGGGRKGDILVSVEVTVPTKLSGEQRKILEGYRGTVTREAGKKKRPSSGTRSAGARDGTPAR